MANRRSQSDNPPSLRRILIVDDDVLVALIIEEMVRNTGRKVSAIAPTAALARQQFAKGNFDAVLLDIKLQGCPHPELADILLTRGTPFAFITGYDYLVEPRHEAIPMLQKPFTPAKLGA